MQERQAILLQLLETSYFSHDNAQRAEALQKLELEINQDPDFFVSTTCQFLAQSDTPINKKTLVLTALRSLLKPTPTSKWYLLSSEK